jgi:hypothetical protein
MQVELNNMYANIGVNNSSEKLKTKQKTLRLSKNPRKRTLQRQGQRKFREVHV